jgi:hypothetical protein
MRPTPTSVGDTNVTVLDQAGPVLARMARELPNEYNRALRHLGYVMQQEIKAGMRSGAPAGKPWPAPSKATAAIRRMLRGGGGTGGAVGAGVRAQRIAGGKLKNLIRYKHNKDRRRVDIGWIDDRKVRRLAWLFQEGQDQTTTWKQRRLYRRAKLKVGSSIKIPSRQAISPIHEKMRPEMESIMLKRIDSYINKTTKYTPATVRRSRGRMNL